MIDVIRNSGFSSVFNEVIYNLIELKQDYKHLKNAYDALRKQIETSESDTVTSELNKELDDLRKHAVVLLSDSELERYHKFKKEHAHTNKIEFRVTSTGFSSMTELRCPWCDTIEDITDTECW